MLPKTFRLTAENKSGVTIAIAGVVVKATAWKYVNGERVDSEELTILSNAGTIANGVFTAEDTFDNSVSKWHGMECVATITVPSTPNGDVVIYYDHTTDAGATFVTQGLAVPVARINFTSGTTKRIGFRL